MINKKTALKIVGGLSSPSKLPCYSYSIPANACKMGSKLRCIKNSVCSKCYAHKGFYKLYKNVAIALQRRFESLNHPQWVESMTHLVNNMEKSGYFRWHDSGDIQSIDHLDKIVEVARNTPNVKHWFPTREYKMVSDYLKSGKSFPDNFIVRLSAFMIEGKPPVKFAEKIGVLTSGVSKKNFNCKAPFQDNMCGDCRMCWNKNVKNVIYHAH